MSTSSIATATTALNATSLWLDTWTEGKAELEAVVTALALQEALSALPESRYLRAKALPLEAALEPGRGAQRKVEAFYHLAREEAKADLTDLYGAGLFKVVAYAASTMVAGWAAHRHVVAEMRKTVVADRSPDTLVMQARLEVARAVDKQARLSDQLAYLVYLKHGLPAAGIIDTLEYADPVATAYAESMIRHALLQLSTQSVGNEVEKKGMRLMVRQIGAHLSAVPYLA